MSIQNASEPWVDTATVPGEPAITEDELDSLNDLADAAGLLVRAEGSNNSDRGIHLPDPLADAPQPVCQVDGDEWLAKPAKCFPPAFRDWCRYCKVGFRHAAPARRQAIRAIDPQALGWEISGIVGGDGV